MKLRSVGLTSPEPASTGVVFMPVGTGTQVLLAAGFTYVKSVEWCPASFVSNPSAIDDLTFTTSDTIILSDEP